MSDFKRFIVIVVMMFVVGVIANDQYPEECQLVVDVIKTILQGGAKI